MNFVYKKRKPSEEVEQFHRHMHNEYEILYFLQGDTEYFIESTAYRLQRGDLLLVKPRTYHHVNRLSNAVYERFVITFSEEEISCGLFASLKDKQGIYAVPQGGIIDRFFQTVIEEKQRFSPEEMEAFKRAGLTQILVQLLHMPAKTHILPKRAHPTLEAILKYVNEHPEADLSAEKLAAKYFVSVSWVVHAFRKNLGISLMQYVNQKKVLYAQKLIQQGVSPTEAALQCGFDTYTTFYRQYKKTLNRLPKTDKR
ncbi:MAG: helix-turn-helix transcriptional regulator [Clostridia bacterium]|nr:helix-turn-helix transcriptional regulator [Clostridia bacterium]MBQ5802226.1 helix-turn-helix transcriptional regulator [Clostridia bacterium]